jgi:hypothetical protein
MTHPSLALRAGLAASALGALLALGGCGAMSMGSAEKSAQTASMQTLHATLSGAAEVPTNTSAGSGTLAASYDKSSGVLRWKVTYAGLSGPATMAHFHGPAMPGSNAGVAVPFPSAASPAEGQATLTPAQAADLLAGKWYVNVHTAQHPGGEIRGQVLAN